MEIREIILNKLSEIEEKENVRILHCVESGSRAWGFASPDSDYDVRFIYVRKPEFYLKLEKTSDVIEWQLDDTLDINGWDLQKALRLLHNSNPTLFEWNSSPIVYKTTDEWKDLNDTINAYFNVKSGVYHYLNTAKSNNKAYLLGDTVKFKKYFYALRPLLACKWILHKETPSPVLFSELVESELEADMCDIVYRLIEMKVNTPEISTGERIEAINSYINNQIAEVEEKLGSLSYDKNHDWERLNDAFLGLVMK